MCGPRGLKGEPDHLFHNNGDGTFTDVSEKAGVADKPGYYGLALVFVDINNDGKPDLLVGNDSTPNYLYINKGDGTFEDASYASGYALNENGRETASMGIAVGDYQNNGLLDLFNTTFSDDYKPLYRNDGDANFTDISYQIGHRRSHRSLPRLGRRLLRLRQRRLERPHRRPTATSTRRSTTYNWGTSWAQRPLLFHNLQGKKFELSPQSKAPASPIVIAGRGMAVGDLFNDGKIDAVINVHRRPPSAAAQRQPRHTPLDRTQAHRRPQEPPRRRRRHGLPHRRTA